MNVLILIVLALLFFVTFGTSGYTPASQSGSQACAIDESGMERCGPELVGDRYQVPAEGEVIHARVNNGPVAPDYQEGYEIVVEADGTVTITEMPEGSSDDLSDEARTAEQEVRTEQIGEEGVQDLLWRLDGCGFYYLPQRDEVDPADLPDGGSISILEVQLEDGTWEAFNQALTSANHQSQFSDCQEMLADEFDVES